MKSHEQSLRITCQEHVFDHVKIYAEEICRLHPELTPCDPTGRVIQIHSKNPELIEPLKGQFIKEFGDGVTFTTGPVMATANARLN